MQDKIIPKSFLAFLLLCFGGDVNAVIVQKLDYEGCWQSHCDTSCLISAACKDYSQNLALGRIDRAAAGTWPSSFIYDQFPRSIFVNSLPVCGDISSRRERLHDAERKARESDWHSIQGLKNIESQWIDSRRGLTNRLTDRQIQRIINLAVLEPEPVHINNHDVPAPSITRNIYSHDASLLFQVSNDVSCGHEVGIFVNKKSRSINKPIAEFSLGVELRAQNRNDGALDTINRVNESVRRRASRRIQHGNKENSKKNARSAANTSGSMTIKDDGTFIGCDVSHPSASVLPISCPQLDSSVSQNELP